MSRRPLPRALSRPAPRTRALLVVPAVAVGVGAAMTLSPVAANASTHGSGSVAVLATVLGKASPQTRICAVGKASPAGKPVKGRCGTTSSSGRTTLKDVPAGSWYITAFTSTGQAFQTAAKKVHVSAGRTTAFTFVIHPG